jgi:hypothetical protein
MFAKAGNYRYSAKPNTDPVEYYTDGTLPPDYNYIQELSQTFYVTQRDVDVTHNLFRGVGEYLHGVPLWHPDTRTEPDANSNLPHTVDMIGTPEWGIVQATDASGSDAFFPGTPYRTLNSSRYDLMQLMVLVWGLKEKVNHNAWFDYTDRYATYWINLSTEGYGTWKAYRHLYGCVYTGLDTITHERQYDCSRCVHDCPGTRITEKENIIPPHSSVYRAFPNPISLKWLGTIPANATLHALDGNPVRTDKYIADGVYLIKQGNRTYKAIIVQ